MKPAQVGCLWSLTSAVKEQLLLTVWDTGAAVSGVSKSTIVQTGTDWVPQLDMDFVMADGAKHTPLGCAPKFVFRISDLFFVLKVYVVEGANYQLLLGTSFMFDVGAALFPSWKRIILSIPLKLELQASLESIRRDTCAPLKDEADQARVIIHRLDNGTPKTASVRGLRQLGEVPCIEEVQDDEVVKLGNPVTVTYVGVGRSSAPEPDRGLSPVLQLTMAVGLRDLASTYRLGMKHLVREVECHVVESVDRSFPVLTCEFVESCIEFGAAVPRGVRAVVCQHIIDYSHAFSWNAFDLGCISDVPHRVVRVDASPAVHPSRKHLYSPHNEAVLHGKCDPYIEMGIF